jgi:hypothetical protein
MNISSAFGPRVVRSSVVSVSDEHAAATSAAAARPTDRVSLRMATIISPRFRPPLK